jgi:hypothetical protein
MPPCSSQEQEQQEAARSSKKQQEAARSSKKQQEAVLAEYSHAKRW